MGAGETSGGVGVGRIVGVLVRPRVMHRDERGNVCELFVGEDDTDFEARQWHALTSLTGTLRGMHLHVKHWDHKIVVAGREALVLKDLRRGSPSEGEAMRLELSAAELTSVTIPPGVAHGLYAYEDSVTLVGSSALYDPGDEFEFGWNDPELGVSWPAVPTRVSPRDRNAQPLRALLQQIEPWQPLG